jgi:peptide/nickel transport system substrate-binding protein
MKTRYTWIALAMIAAMLLGACGPQAAPAPQVVEVTRIVAGTPEKVVITATPAPTSVPAPTKAPAAPTTAPAPAAGAMTDVGTPRSETLVFQTFDRQTANPDQHNPLMAYAQWRGFRELGWGYLWEMDTGTGKSYAELADGFPEVLNKEYTQFRIKIKKGIFWSDGVEFTVDDIIYTLETILKNKDKITNGGARTVSNYVKSFKKVDNYTFEVETTGPKYDLITVFGTYTWGANLTILPKHVFEKQADVLTFRNTKPVTLGPYTLKEFDPNGYWALWQRRDDWQRSAWGWMGEPKPKYVLYKDFGGEETRLLAFAQNQYDVDTFMSPDSIKAAQKFNPAITTFSKSMPYHNMNDACVWGVVINQHKPPLDKVEVRWALALALDLQSVGINAMNGEFKASVFPMPDTEILRPIYYEPLLPWVKEFALADGYKPFNANFGADLAARLQKMGTPANVLPQGEKAISNALGMGWWKYDTAQAAKLLTSVGFKKNAAGAWLMPDGAVWQLDFVFPGDWNKAMQRIGFSMADSWKKFGVQVNARQVDNAEFTATQNTNSLLQTELNWTNCVFTPNYVNAYRTLSKQWLLPADDTKTISGNVWRWNNEKAFALAAEAQTLPHDAPRFQAIGQELLQEFTKDMAYITIMNIPTTIPTNEYYWSGFPKQENFYAVPYSWWSSTREMIINIKPTGKR